MTVSKRTRFEVFKRDRFTCQYCGRRPPDVVLEADHIVPKREGGPDTIDNLTTSCEPCNRGKAGKGLGDVAPGLDEMQAMEAIQEMAERARALRQQIAVADQNRRAEQEAVDVVLGWWDDIGGFTDDEEQRTKDASSVRRFLRNLTIDEMRDAVEATRRLWDRRPRMGQGEAWRYFCGACWGMIRDKEARR